MGGVIMTVLELTKEKVEACTRCPVLCESRSRTVFGNGNPHARLMLIGEGPGKNEDEQGIPFVGEAGQLLNNIIKAAGWNRDDLYITNVVKCRPPNNRIPAIQEVENCSEYLNVQIKAVNPEFILLLGSTATNAILGCPVSAARGEVHQWKGRTIYATYHPAYLLRNPADKVVVWNDLQPLIEALKKDINTT
jgi:DNA polymerase